MEFHFEAKVWYWRGPAPFYFVSLPEAETQAIRDISSQITYGWGMIPVDATIGRTTYYTAMFYKDERYVLPIKAAIRRSESIDLDQTIEVLVALRTEHTTKSGNACRIR